MRQIDVLPAAFILKYYQLTNYYMVTNSQNFWGGLYKIFSSGRSTSATIGIGRHGPYTKNLPAGLIELKSSI